MLRPTRRVRRRPCRRLPQPRQGQRLRPRHTSRSTRLSTAVVQRAHLAGGGAAAAHGSEAARGDAVAPPVISIGLLDYCQARTSRGLQPGHQLRPGQGGLCERHGEVRPLGHCVAAPGRLATPSASTPQHSPPSPNAVACEWVTTASSTRSTTESWRCGSCTSDTAPRSTTPDPASECPAPIQHRHGEGADSLGSRPLPACTLDAIPSMQDRHGYTLKRNIDGTATTCENARYASPIQRVSSAHGWAGTAVAEVVDMVEVP